MSIQIQYTFIEDEKFLFILAFFSKVFQIQLLSIQNFIDRKFVENDANNFCTDIRDKKGIKKNKIEYIYKLSSRKSREPQE